MTDLCDLRWHQGRIVAKSLNARARGLSELFRHLEADLDAIDTLNGFGDLDADLLTASQRLARAYGVLAPALSLFVDAPAPVRTERAGEFAQLLAGVAAAEAVFALELGAARSRWLRAFIAEDPPDAIRDDALRATPP